MPFMGLHIWPIAHTVCRYIVVKRSLLSRCTRVCELGSFTLLALPCLTSCVSASAVPPFHLFLRLTSCVCVSASAAPPCHLCPPESVDPPVTSFSHPLSPLFHALCASLMLHLQIALPLSPLFHALCTFPKLCVSRVVCVSHLCTCLSLCLSCLCASLLSLGASLLLVGAGVGLCGLFYSKLCGASTAQRTVVATHLPLALLFPAPHLCGLHNTLTLDSPSPLLTLLSLLISSPCCLSSPCCPTFAHSPLPPRRC